ncbi:GNAT family N-acetyltransferase [Flagellimonas baculiformis]|uniref:GNAT family N-acetyltransferase n=1 Tax=Flagellimonas baculiformis TaxID=3067310 RepID=UPI00296E8241|nr:GNAT family N-acetyltransferase [Muricauda sp. D6]
MELNTGPYHIRTGVEQMDIGEIHRFLSMESYWAKGISFEMVKESLRYSYCVGMFLEDSQIGFARLITDYTTFAYLADVFVMEPYRGKGLSKRLMQHIMDLDVVMRCRRVLLATKDAHSLYNQFGFTAPGHPQTFMETRKKDGYGTGPGACPPVGVHKGDIQGNNG